MGDPSWNQYLAWLTAMMISSSLSVCGSLALLVLLRNDLKSVYHRTLFMISAIDLVWSFSNVFHLMLVPADRSKNPFAFGDQTSCEVVGFILGTSLNGISIYNAFLSMNFLLQVRYQWTDQRIASKLEPLVHMFAFVCGLVPSIIGLFTESINPDFLSGLCRVVEYPNRCTDYDDLPCERGGDLANMLALIPAGFAYIFGMIGLGSTYALYTTVKQTIDQSGRHAQIDQQLDERQQERLRRVSAQCTRYAFAYANTVAWPMLCLIVDRTTDPRGRLGEPQFFALLLFPYMFFPLQGMLNFTVFISPKYYLWRKALPEEPTSYVMRRALTMKDPPRRIDMRVSFPAGDSGTLANSKILSRFSVDSRYGQKSSIQPSSEVELGTADHENAPHSSTRVGSTSTAETKDDTEQQPTAIPEASIDDDDDGDDADSLP